jgi:hypothetical protein
VIFLQDFNGAGMKKKSNDPEISLSPVTKKGGKTETIEALNQLGWALQELVQNQSFLSKSKQHLIRLRIYDIYMKDLVTAFEALSNLLQVKQAGGRSVNKYFSMAYEIVKDHYRDTSEILRAKTLVKVVNKRLSEKDKNPDEQGNEPFSERLAGNCIRLFKRCLPYENF